MTLGQEKSGAFDGYYQPRSNYETQSMNLYSQTRDFINFNKVEELYGDTYNISPRFHICDIDTTYSGPSSACIMAWDFERERKIELAP